MQSNYKKILLVAILVGESFFILYLLNYYKFHGNFYAVFVDLPKSLVSRQNNTNSTLKYFTLPEPNTYEVANYSKYGTIVYSSNADGLRDRYNYSIEKPYNTYRIAIFGDSDTYGVFVNLTDTYAKILEDRFSSLNCSKKIEVMNFGVAGYDFPYMAEFFKEKGKQYSPDFIIFSVKKNNVQVNYELLQPIFDNYANNTEISFEDIYNEYIEKYSNYFDSSTWLQGQIVKPMNMLQAENAGRSKILIFTYLISRLPRKPIIPLNNSVDMNAFMKGQSLNHGFLYVSIDDYGTDYYKTWDEKFSLSPNKDPHPNKLGHQFLADFLYSYFISSNLVSC